MNAYQITTSLADTHRQDLIAEARPHRLGRASREAAEPRRAAGTVAFARFRRAGRVAFAR